MKSKTTNVNQSNDKLEKEKVKYDLEEIEINLHGTNDADNSLFKSSSANEASKNHNEIHHDTQKCAINYKNNMNTSGEVLPKEELIKPKAHNVDTEHTLPAHIVNHSIINDNSCSKRKKKKNNSALSDKQIQKQDQVFIKGKSCQDKNYSPTPHRPNQNSK